MRRRRAQAAGLAYRGQHSDRVGAPRAARFPAGRGAGRRCGQSFVACRPAPHSDLLWNTVRLTVAVSALCTVIGTGAAWLVERTNLPGRRAWAVLLVVPLAIPDFVISFGWASLSRDISGFRGAVLVMTLAVYPLVYLPVASSLRNADPALEEVSQEPRGEPGSRRFGGSR